MQSLPVVQSGDQERVVFVLAVHVRIHDVLLAILLLNDCSSCGFFGSLVLLVFSRLLHSLSHLLFLAADLLTDLAQHAEDELVLALDAVSDGD